MTNSCTVCQFFVDIVLRSSHATLPHSYIIYDVNNILITYSNESKLQNLYEDVIMNLPPTGLQVATEKYQMLPPYKYLGYVLEHTSVHSQKIYIDWKDITDF